ncbi:hypothetical protein LIER_06766 [Lithospermum erythrorhizon]|uniref:RNase H type-1 domain-containing protein n=1 Tax=Lithospermum erythrorhizon TaxID=34254 RepID=A0AAV3P6G1_LITER
MLVDTGSLADILDKLGLARKHLKPVATPLTGFMGHSIQPMGIADVRIGKGPRMVTVRASFTVVDIADPSYNGLIGRPLLTALRAIVSPLHLKMKFPTPRGVGEMTGDQKRGRECYQLTIPRGLSKMEPPKRKGHQEKHPRVMNVGEPIESECQDNDPNDFESQKRGMPHEDLEIVAFDERKSDRVFRIGTWLGEEYLEALIALIKKYREVFAWGAEDMIGIKVQVLADFIVENSIRSVSEAPSQEKALEEAPKWILYVDGVTTNNEAEYEAMVAGLQMAKVLDINCLKVRGDSKLVIEHVRGDYGVKNDILKKYHAKALLLTQGFEYVIFEHIPCTENEHADHLCRLENTYNDEMPIHVKVEIRKVLPTRKWRL